jgi:membrane-associated phospholipid phosphatase
MRWDRRVGATSHQGVAAAAPTGALRAVDRLLLGAAGALGAVALVTGASPLLLLVLAAVAATLVGAARLRHRSPAAALAHDLLPVAAVVAIFSACGPLVEAATSARWDAALAAADLRLFGGLPAAWRGLLGRPAWLTDLASLAYCSYYLVPVAMAVAVRARNRPGEFDALVFALVGTLVLSFAGYFLLPATGPRVPDAQAQAVLGGGAVSRAVRLFLAHAEVNLLDAFPSGHTALSLVFLGHGWRLLPRWRPALLLSVGGIVFATVYLSLHYVVDLLAGALLAAATPLLLPPLRRLLGDPR